MNTIIMGGQFILGLSILVTLHELGHFLAARVFGIKVEKFYLFFDAWGFKVFSFKYKGTEYGMGWLPLGGYVKIAGMVDESMDKEQLKKPAQPWEFRAKPAWQRLIVMIGGVTMNVILGIVIFSYITLHYSKYYIPNNELKQGIYSYSLGKKVGLQNGDKILAIDGKPVVRFEDLLSNRVIFGANLSVQREGQTLAIKVPDDFYKSVKEAGKGKFIGPDLIPIRIGDLLPDSAADKAGMKKGDQVVGVNGTPLRWFGELREQLALNAGKEIQVNVIRSQDSLPFNVKVSKTGTIGFFNDSSFIPKKEYSVSEGFSYGAKDAFEAVIVNAKGLGKLVTGKEKASESIQGPIGIAKIYGSEVNWFRFWTITGLLSMVLALMNILPIPALDGGHVIFLVIEAATGRKFSDKFMERAQVVGMVILLSLMVFALGNDIKNMFH